MFIIIFLCCVIYLFVFDFIGMLIAFVLAGDGGVGRCDGVLCSRGLAHELSTCVSVHLLCLTCLVAKGFQHIKIICTTVQSNKFLFLLWGLYLTHFYRRF